ncbi:MAG: hypothetical protein ABFD44_07675 [Anaerolineaceae bacterium]
MESKPNWKTKFLIIGAVVGALTGLGAAYILVQRAESSQEKPKLTAGDGVKIGMGLLGVLRMISDSGKG